MIKEEESTHGNLAVGRANNVRSEISMSGETKNVSIQITERGIDDLNDQATVCIGHSIEVRRKRIASGTIHNRVKFTMQPYH